jgi:hypothetical protein
VLLAVIKEWRLSEFPQSRLERVGLSGRPCRDPQPRRWAECGFGQPGAPESGQRQCRRLKQRRRHDLNRMGDLFRIANGDFAARLGQHTNIGEPKANNGAGTRVAGGPVAPPCGPARLAARTPHADPVGQEWRAWRSTRAGLR